MKYVVLKDFYDRYDSDRLCRPGEPHTPPNEDRAKQLIDLGFIKAVPEEPTPGDKEQQGEEKPETDDADKTPKKRGRRKKAADVEADGDPDGETPADE